MYTLSWQQYSDSEPIKVNAPTIEEGLRAIEEPILNIIAPYTGCDLRSKYYPFSHGIWNIEFYREEQYICSSYILVKKIRTKVEKGMYIVNTTGMIARVITMPDTESEFIGIKWDGAISPYLTGPTR